MVSFANLEVFYFLELCPIFVGPTQNTLISLKHIYFWFRALAGAILGIILFVKTLQSQMIWILEIWRLGPLGYWDLSDLWDL